MKRNVTLSCDLAANDALMATGRVLSFIVFMQNKVWVLLVNYDGKLKFGARFEVDWCRRTEVI